MAEIKGFKEITYEQLNTILNDNFKSLELSKEEIAVKTSVTTQTIYNILSSDSQPVTDKTLISVSKELGVEVLVVVNDESKAYFIKKKRVLTV